MCRKCKEALTGIEVGGFDVMAILNGNPQLMYCDNEECDLFGFVVVAGAIDNQDPQPDEKGE